MDEKSYIKKYRDYLSQQNIPHKNFTDDQILYQYGKEAEAGGHLEKMPNLARMYRQANARIQRERDGLMHYPNQLIEGLKKGGNITGGTIFGGIGLIGDTVGISTPGSDSLAEEFMRDAGKAKTTVKSLKDAETVADYADFFVAGIGEVVPTMVTIAGTGGATGLLAGAGLKVAPQVMQKKIVGKAISKEIKKRGPSKSSASLIADKNKAFAELGKEGQEIARRYAQTWGNYGGSAATSGTMGMGEVYTSLLPYTRLPETHEDYIPIEDAQAYSFAFGSAIGALDNIVPSILGGQVLRKFFPGKANISAIDAARADNFVKKSLFKAMGAGMVLEGGTEATQEWLSIAADKFAHARQDDSTGFGEDLAGAFSDPDFYRLLDAGVLGAIGGGVAGGAFTLAENTSVPKRQAQKQAEDDAVQAARLRNAGFIEDARKNLEERAKTIYDRKALEEGDEVFLATGQEATYIRPIGEGRGVFAYTDADGNTQEVETLLSPPFVTPKLSASKSVVDAYAKNTRRQAVQKAGEELLNPKQPSDPSIVDKFKEDAGVEQQEQKKKEEESKVNQAEITRNEKNDQGITNGDQAAYDALEKTIYDAGITSDVLISEKFTPALKRAIENDAYAGWVESNYDTGKEGTPSKEDMLNAFRRAHKVIHKDGRQTSADIQAEEAKKAAEEAEEESVRKQQEFERKAQEDDLNDRKADIQAKSYQKEDGGKVKFLAGGFKKELDSNPNIGDLADAEWKIVSANLENGTIDVEANGVTITADPRNFGKKKLPKQQQAPELRKTKDPKLKSEPKEVEGYKKDESEIKQKGEAFDALPEVENGTYVIKFGNSKTIIEVTEDGWMFSRGGSVGTGEDISRPKSLPDIILRATGRNLYDLSSIRFSDEYIINATFDGVTFNFTLSSPISVNMPDYEAGLNEQETNGKFRVLDGQWVFDGGRQKTDLLNEQQHLMLKSRFSLTEDPSVEVVRSELIEAKTSSKNAKQRKDMPSVESAKIGSNESNGVIVLRHKASGQIFLRTAVPAGAVKTGTQDVKITKLRKRNSDQPNALLTAVDFNKYEQLPEVFEKIELILFSARPGSLRMRFDSLDQYENWVSGFKKFEVESKLTVHPKVPELIKKYENDKITKTHDLHFALAHDTEENDVFFVEQDGKPVVSESIGIYLPVGGRRPAWHYLKTSDILEGMSESDGQRIVNKIYEILDNPKRGKSELGHEGLMGAMQSLEFVNPKETEEAPLRTIDVRTLVQYFSDKEQLVYDETGAVINEANAERVARAFVSALFEQLKRGSGAANRKGRDDIIVRVDKDGKSENITEQAPDQSQTPSESVSESIALEEAMEVMQNEPDPIKLGRTVLFNEFNTEQLKTLHQIAISKVDFEMNKEELIEVLGLMDVTPEFVASNRVEQGERGQLMDLPSMVANMENPSIDGIIEVIAFIKHIGDKVEPQSIVEIIQQQNKAPSIKADEAFKLESDTYGKVNIAVRNEYEALVNKVLGSEAQLSDKQKELLSSAFSKILNAVRRPDETSGMMQDALEGIAEAFEENGMFAFMALEESGATKISDFKDALINAKDDANAPAISQTTADIFIEFLKNVSTQVLPNNRIHFTELLHDHLNRKINKQGPLLLMQSEFRKLEESTGAIYDKTSAPNKDPISEMRDPYGSDSLPFTPDITEDSMTHMENISKGQKSNTSQSKPISEQQKVRNAQAMEEVFPANMPGIDLSGIALDNIGKIISNQALPESMDFATELHRVLTQMMNARQDAGLPVINFDRTTTLSSEPGQITRGLFSPQMQTVFIDPDFFLGEADPIGEPLPITGNKEKDILMLIGMHELWHGTMEDSLHTYEEQQRRGERSELSDVIDLIDDVINEVAGQAKGTKFSGLFAQNVETRRREILNRIWNRRDLAEWLSTKGVSSDLQKRIDENGEGFVGSLLDALYGAYLKLLKILGINTDGTALKALLDLNRRLDQHYRELQPQEITTVDMAAMSEQAAQPLYSKLSKVILEANPNNAIEVADDTESLRQELNKLQKEQIPALMKAGKREEAQPLIARQKEIKQLIKDQTPKKPKGVRAPKKATGKKWLDFLRKSGVSNTELEMTVGPVLEEVSTEISYESLSAFIESVDQTKLVRTGVYEKWSSYQPQLPGEQIEYRELVMYAPRLEQLNAQEVSGIVGEEMGDNPPGYHTFNLTSENYHEKGAYEYMMSGLLPFISRMEHRENSKFAGENFYDYGRIKGGKLFTKQSYIDSSVEEYAYFYSPDLGFMPQEKIVESKIEYYRGERAFMLILQKIDRGYAKGEIGNFPTYRIVLLQNRGTSMGYVKEDFPTSSFYADYKYTTGNPQSDVHLGKQTTARMINKIKAWTQKYGRIRIDLSDADKEYVKPFFTITTETHVDMDGESPLGDFDVISPPTNEQLFEVGLRPSPSFVNGFGDIRGLDKTTRSANNHFPDQYLGSEWLSPENPFIPEDVPNFTSLYTIGGAGVSQIPQKAQHHIRYAIQEINGERWAIIVESQSDAMNYVQTDPVGQLEDMTLTSPYAHKHSGNYDQDFLEYHEWLASKDYKKGDIAYFGNALFVATEDNPSLSPEESINTGSVDPFSQWKPLGKRKSGAMVGYKRVEPSDLKHVYITTKDGWQHVYHIHKEVLDMYKESQMIDASDLTFLGQSLVNLDIVESDLDAALSGVESKVKVEVVIRDTTTAVAGTVGGEKTYKSINILLNDKDLQQEFSNELKSEEARGLHTNLIEKLMGGYILSTDPYGFEFVNQTDTSTNAPSILQEHNELVAMKLFLRDVAMAGINKVGIVRGDVIKPVVYGGDKNLAEDVIEKGDIKAGGFTSAYISVAQKFAKLVGSELQVYEDMSGVSDLTYIERVRDSLGREVLPYYTRGAMSQGSLAPVVDTINAIEQKFKSLGQGRSYGKMKGMIFSEAEHAALHAAEINEPFMPYGKFTGHGKQLPHKPAFFTLGAGMSGELEIKDDSPIARLAVIDERNPMAIHEFAGEDHVFMNLDANNVDARERIQDAYEGIVSEDGYITQGKRFEQNPENIAVALNALSKIQRVKLKPGTKDAFLKESRELVYKENLNMRLKSIFHKQRYLLSAVVQGTGNLDEIQNTFTRFHQVLGLIQPGKNSDTFSKYDPSAFVSMTLEMVENEAVDRKTGGLNVEMKVDNGMLVGTISVPDYQSLGVSSEQELFADYMNQVEDGDVTMEEALEQFEDAKKNIPSRIITDIESIARLDLDYEEQSTGLAAGLTDLGEYTSIENAKEALDRYFKQFPDNSPIKESLLPIALNKYSARRSAWLEGAEARIAQYETAYRAFKKRKKNHFPQLKEDFDPDYPKKYHDQADRRIRLYLYDPVYAFFIDHAMEQHRNPTEELGEARIISPGSSYSYFDLDSVDSIKAWEGASVPFFDIVKWGELGNLNVPSVFTRGGRKTYITKGERKGVILSLYDYIEDKYVREYKIAEEMEATYDRLRKLDDEGNLLPSEITVPSNDRPARYALDLPKRFVDLIDFTQPSMRSAVTGSYPRGDEIGIGYQVFGKNQIATVRLQEFDGFNIIDRIVPGTNRIGVEGLNLGLSDPNNVLIPPMTSSALRSRHDKIEQSGRLLPEYSITGSEMNYVDISDDRLKQNLYEGEKLLMQDDLNKIRANTRTHLAITRVGEDQFKVEGLAKDEVFTARQLREGLVRFKDMPSRVGILELGENGKPLERDGYHLFREGDIKTWVPSSHLEAYDSNDASKMADQLDLNFEGKVDNSLNYIVLEPNNTDLKKSQIVPRHVAKLYYGSGAILRRYDTYLEEQSQEEQADTDELPDLYTEERKPAYENNKELLKLIVRSSFPWGSNSRSDYIRVLDSVEEETGLPRHRILREINSIKKIFDYTPDGEKDFFQYELWHNGRKVYPKFMQRGSDFMSDPTIAPQENSLPSEIKPDDNVAANMKIVSASVNEASAPVAYASQDIRQLLGKPDMSLDEIWNRYLKGQSPTKEIQKLVKRYGAEMEFQTADLHKNNPNMRDETRSQTLKRLEKQIGHIHKQIANISLEFDPSRRGSIASKIAEYEDRTILDEGHLFDRARYGDRIRDRIDVLISNTEQALIEETGEEKTDPLLNAYRAITGNELTDKGFRDALIQTASTSSGGGVSASKISDLILQLSKIKEVEKLNAKAIYELVKTEFNNEGRAIIVSAVLAKEARNFIELAKLSQSKDMEGRRDLLAKLRDLSRATLGELKVLNSADAKSYFPLGNTVERGIQKKFVEDRIALLEAQEQRAKKVIDQEIYQRLLEEYNLDSQKMQMLLGHNPAKQLNDGDKFPVMTKIEDGYTMSEITVRMSNFMQFENFDEIKAALRLNKKYLDDPEVTQDNDYRYVKQMQMNAEIMPIWQAHYETGGMFQMHSLKSARERFQEMGPLGREIAQMINQFEIGYKANAPKARAMSRNWNVAFDNARKAFGFKEGHKFMDQVIGPVIKWNEDQPQLSGQREEFLRGAWSYAQKLVDKDDLAEGAEDALIKLLDAYKDKSRFHRELAQQYGLKVLDETIKMRDPMGRPFDRVKDSMTNEELQYGTHLQRNPIDRGELTVPRSLRPELIQAIINQMPQLGWSMEGSDASHTGEFNWSDLKSIVESKEIDNDTKLERLDFASAELIDDYVWEKFMVPYIDNNTSPKAFLFTPVGEQAIPRQTIEDAYQEVKGLGLVGNKAFDAWVQALYERVPHREDRADFAQFKHAALVKYKQKYRQLRRSVSDIGSKGLDASITLAGHLMDSRSQSADIPIDFLRYTTYDEVTSPALVAKTMENAFFGRNAEILVSKMKQLVDETNAKHTALKDLASIINNPRSEGRIKVKGRYKDKAYNELENNRIFENVPGKTGKDKLQNLLNAQSQMNSLLGGQLGGPGAVGHLEAYLLGDLGPFQDEKLAYELLGLNAYFVLNQPKSGVTNLMSIWDFDSRYGGAVGKDNISDMLFGSWAAAGELIGGLLANFGIDPKTQSEEAEVLMPIFFNTYENDVGFKKNFLNVGAKAVKKNNFLGKDFRYDILRRGKTLLDYDSRRGAKVKNQEGDRKYAPIGLRTMFLKPFSYFGSLANHSIAVANARKVSKLVHQIATYIEDYNAIQEKNGKPLLPQDYQVTSDELGKRLSDKIAFDRLDLDLGHYGLGSLSNLARDYMERRSKGDKRILTKEQIIVSGLIGVNEVALEGGFSTTPAFLNSPYMRWAAPLQKWALNKVKQMNRSVRDLKNGEMDAKAALLMISTIVGLKIPLGLAYTFFWSDWYDEELLGKASPLRPLPKSAMLPLIGPFIEGDPANNLKAMLERVARAGNVGGMALDFVNATYNEFDTYSYNRGFSLDNRILIMSQLLNIRQAMGNMIGMGEIDYANVVRPMLYSMGFNGPIQQYNLFANAFGSDSEERRISNQIGNRHKLRAGIHTLGIEGRPMVGGTIKKTKFSAAVRRMERSAESDDAKGFNEAYKEAIEASIDRGDEDPEDAVIKAFKRRNLRTGISRYKLSDEEWEGVLGLYDKEASEPLREAMRMHEKYVDILDASKPKKGFVLPKPDITIKPVSYDDIIRRSLSF